MLMSLTNITKSVDLHSSICKSNSDYLIRTDNPNEMENTLREKGYDCYVAGSRYVRVVGSNIDILV